MHIVAVAIDGAVTERLAASGESRASRSADRAAPGPLLVNAIGRGLLGFLVAPAGSRFSISPAIRSFVTIGLPGGLAAFSGSGTWAGTIFISKSDRLLAGGKAWS